MLEFTEGIKTKQKILLQQCNVSDLLLPLDVQTFQKIFKMESHDINDFIITIIPLAVLAIFQYHCSL